MTCKDKVVLGTRYCSKHLIEHRESERNYRAVAAENGVCYTCRKNKAVLRPDKMKVPACESCYLKRVAGYRLGDRKRWVELKELFERQPICPYTGFQLEIGKSASLDHIVPTGRGGSHEIGNLQWVYSYGDLDINFMKGDMPDGVFREIIERICKVISNQKEGQYVTSDNGV